MKVLCDVHISFKLISFFRRKNIEAIHVNTILDSFFSSDKAIATYADQNKLIVITKDIDFRNSYFIRKSPQRLIRICLGNINTTDLITIFEQQLNFLEKAYQSHTFFYIEINSNNTLILTE